LFGRSKTGNGLIPRIGKKDKSIDRNAEGTFAFRIYMTHRESMRAFFSKVLNGPEEVSDAMQELFLKLARQKDLEQHCHNPKAYLYRTATNMLNDILRKKYARSLDMHVSLEQETIEARGLSPEESANVRQQIKLVREACDRLSEGERKAFFMHRVNKMTYQEISAELGVSERTVRRWVVQALSYLQEAVGSQLEKS
jgi:RNA polymerase sigma-70 factor (ECF subfamily)